MKLMRQLYGKNSQYKEMRKLKRKETYEINIKILEQSNLKYIASGSGDGDGMKNFLFYPKEYEAIMYQPHVNLWLILKGDEKPIFLGGTVEEFIRWYKNLTPDEEKFNKKMMYFLDKKGKK